MRSRQGFTLVELLVVIAVIAILAALLLPTLSHAKAQAQTVKCLSNLHQVAVSWASYNGDSQGRFPASAEGSSLDSDYPVWCYGFEGYTGSVSPPDPPDCDTNTDYIKNPNYSSIGPYLKSPFCLRCPADQSCDHAGQQGSPRLRSYSMNEAVGCNWLGLAGGRGGQQGLWLPYTSFRLYLKEADVVLPSPAKLFVMVDENADTINDDGLAVNMPTATQTRWVDMPSKRHDNSCVFSFADSHVEIHRWLQPQNVAAELDGPRSANPDVVRLFDTPTPQPDPDIWWVGHRTSYPLDASLYAELMNYPDSP